MGKNKKRRKSRLLPLLLLGGLAYLVISLVRGVSSVLVGGTSTLIHKVDLQGLELRTFLTIINQGQLTLDVQNFLGQILYQGREVGIVRQVRPVEIAPFATSEIEFSSNIGWVALGMEFYQQAIDLFRAQKSGAKIDLSAFTIKGTLRAENLSIPINQRLL